MIDKDARKNDVINAVSLEMEDRFRKKISIVATENFHQTQEGKFSAIVHKF